MRAFDSKRIEDHHWQYNIQRTEATAIIILNRNEGSHASELSAHALSLPDLHPIRVPSLEDPIPIIPEIKANYFQRSPILHFLLDLAPNSLTLGPSINRPTDARGKYRVESQKERDPLPPQVAILGFSSATHHGYFKRWDYRLQLHGSQNFGYSNVDYVLADEDCIEDCDLENYHQEFAYTSPTVDLILTGKTPAGAFYAKIG